MGGETTLGGSTLGRAGMRTAVRELTVTAASKLRQRFWQMFQIPASHPPGTIGLFLLSPLLCSIRTASFRSDCQGGFCGPMFFVNAQFLNIVIDQNFGEFTGLSQARQSVTCISTAITPHAFPQVVISRCNKTQRERNGCRNCPLVRSENRTGGS